MDEAEEVRGGRRWPNFGWRLSALSVAVVLVVLVAVARQGMPAPRPPAAIVSPAPATPSARADATAAPTVGPSQAPSFPAAVKVLPEPLVELIGSSAFAVSAAPSAARYADGIPSRIKDSVVYRVNEILNLAAQSADGESPWVLIGGWYGAPTSLAPDCAAPPTQANCRTAKIADDPIQLDGQGVAIDGASPTRSGPVVIRGRAQARCTAPAGGRLMYLCLSAIHAVEIVWQGDGATDTTPIGVYDLLTSLAAAFPGFDPQPFQDTPGCSQARPLQSYRSAGGRVQLVFIFPSTESAQAAASALTGSPPGGTCISAPRAAQARWVAQDNVLLRVLGGNGPDGPTARSVLAGLSSGTGE